MTRPRLPVTPAAPQPPDPVLVALTQLFAQFMGLAPDQAMIYNEDWKIPADRRLYITIALLSSRPLGTSCGYEPVDGVVGLTEVVLMNSQETYTINVFSASDEARIRYPEVIMSFVSTIAQQLMEQLSFSLGQIPPSVVDLSQVEGARRLSRYAITLNLLRARRRVNTVPYFDTFTGSPAVIINP